MAKRVLLLCSTTDGQTLRICERLRRILEAAGAAVTLTMIEDARDVTPAGFDLAVVGARIRYGHTDARVIDFARANAATLDAMPNAYFSVNIVARKPGKDRPETNPYVRAFLRQARWRPRRMEAFAGRLDYPRYGVVDRLIIRLIMRLTGGPTRPDTVIEYTDWNRVDAFGRALCADLGLRDAAAAVAAEPSTSRGAAVPRA